MQALLRRRFIWVRIPLVKRLQTIALTTKSAVVSDTSSLEFKTLAVIASIF